MYQVVVFYTASSSTPYATFPRYIDAKRCKEELAKRDGLKAKVVRL
jgi:hypothetical protein